MKLIEFFLNTKEKAKQDVEAPAFSITKVLTASAIVLAPIATLVVDATTKVNLSEGQFVTLALGLLAFLAVIASVDVIARAHVTAVKEAHVGHVLPFDKVMPGHRGKADVSVIAEIDAGDRFLVMEDQKLSIVPRSKLTIP